MQRSTTRHDARRKQLTDIHAVEFIGAITKIAMHLNHALLDLVGVPDFGMHSAAQQFSSRVDYPLLLLH
jgi:hypothetical protein